MNREIKQNIKRLEEDIVQYQKNISLAQKEIYNLQIKAKDVTMSDHAFVRYLEREQGWNVEELKESLLTPDIKQAIEAGATKVKINGLEFVVKEKTIVTILN